MVKLVKLYALGLASIKLKAHLLYYNLTGANLGVGLAGSKLLTASGHCIIITCQTQAKADAATDKCLSYAAASGDFFTHCTVLEVR